MSMVSSVSDYLFVTGADIDATHTHGDLDRIIIDGGVMPLRTGTSATTGVANSKILRGEDIAFLQEALGERYDVAVGGQPFHDLVFSRKVSHTIPMHWCNDIRYNAFITSFLKAPLTEQLCVTSDPRSFYSVTDLASDPDDFATGHQLSESSMLNMFNDTKRLTLCNAVSPTFVTSSNIIVNHVDLDPEYPYTDYSGSEDIAFRSYGGGAGGANGGSNWVYFTTDYSWTFNVPIASLELWKAVNFFVQDGDDYFTTFDFFQIGPATSSDMKTWTFSLDYNYLQSLFLRLCSLHLSRGDITHVPGYQAASGSAYLAGMGIRNAGQYETYCATLGDHTKWWT